MTGVDYDMFVQGGEFLRQGRLYTDFFDNKGPYLYLINALGLCIHSGKWGVFLLETINLAVVLNLLVAIARILGCTKKRTILAIAVFLGVFLSTMKYGDSVEFWSLVPITLSAQLCLKRCVGRKVGSTHAESFVYGCCLGIVAMLRINDGATIGAAAITLAWFLFRRRAWKSLILDFIIFITGILVATAPAILYFSVKGSLFEMVDAVYLFAFKYWHFHLQPAKTTMAINSLLMIGCFLLPVVSWIFDRKKGTKTFSFCLISSVFTILVLLKNMTLVHYYTITLPLVFILVAMASVLRREWTVLIIAAIMAPWLKWLRADLTEPFVRPVAMLVDRNYRDSLFTCSSNQRDRILYIIPENDRDSIYQLEVPNEYWGVVYHSGHLPVGRHVGGQNDTKRILKEAGDSNDILYTFRKANPRWIVSAVRIEESEISEAGEKYEVADSCVVDHQYHFIIYRRKELQ